MIDNLYNITVHAKIVCK